MKTRLVTLILFAGMMVGLTTLPAQADPCTGGYVAFCPTILPGLSLIQIGPIDRICLLPGACPG